MEQSQMPRGRAALIAKLKQKQQSTVGVAPETPISESEITPQPKGRAALLEKLRQSRAQAVGVEPQPSVPEVQSTSTVTKKLEAVTITEPIEREPVTYRGETGTSVPLQVNYIKLLVEKNRGVFEHEVRFIPEVDSKSQRCKFVNEHLRDKGLTKMFDGGSVLYLPQMLENSISDFPCSLPMGDQITMRITFKRKKTMADCIHFYNILFKRIMRELSYNQVGRSYFNMTDSHVIPHHKLEIYPGFVVTVDELEDGLLLCLDVQHRVLRSQNVLELMEELSTLPDFKQQFSKMVLGSAVLTRYNNRTYIIDDVVWDTSVQDTFKNSQGEEISFINYYKNHYNIILKNLEQPMLVNRKMMKSPDGSEKQEQFICLVPELCFLTGLTDAMRSDFKVMKDVAQYTMVSPAHRLTAFRTFLKNVKNSQKSQEILSSWGLQISSDVVDVQGRVLMPEQLLFGGGQQCSAQNADWTRAATQNPVTLPVDLRNWVLFYTARDQQNATKFADSMSRMGQTMGCRIDRPKMCQLRDDRNETYSQAISDNVIRDVQCAVFICPTIRTDRYTVIKRSCCSQIPVASQVIISKNLSNEKRSRAIIQKIALQINCKLGGALWTLRFPFKNWMIIGIDVYHPSKGTSGKSICAVVGSTNESLTRWYSLAVPQQGELGDSLQVVLSKMLTHRRNVVGCYPDKIVVFRDGVGDGQLSHCKDFEIKQFKQTLRNFDLDIKVSFVVVQKRINTRLLLKTPHETINPAPGTVLDHTVTRKNYADFFLVPQNVRQGTVNPTHYIVLVDECNIKPDNMQKLAYKLCHLYYNWTGTIRVPAPCQYAHKLAALYGQHLNSPVATELLDKLFYL